jgi:hypothetical protein
MRSPSRSRAPPRRDRPGDLPLPHRNDGPGWPYKRRSPTDPGLEYPPKGALGTATARAFAVPMSATSPATRPTWSSPRSTPSSSVLAIAHVAAVDRVLDSSALASPTWSPSAGSGSRSRSPSLVCSPSTGSRCDRRRAREHRQNGTDPPICGSGSETMALAGPINDEVPPTLGWSTPKKGRLSDTAAQAIAAPVLVADDEIHLELARSPPSSSSSSSPPRWSEGRAAGEA